MRIAVAVFLLFAIAAFADQPVAFADQPAAFANQPAAFADQPVGATRKNIKALQGLPESQLFMAMNFISDSLGVHCDYCHVKSGDKWLWASDEKPPKATGLAMIRMVLAINKEHFDGSRKLTCYTCHRGSLQVATPRRCRRTIS